MAKFSKAHYVILTDAIARARLQAASLNGENLIAIVASEIAFALAKDNSKFDRDKFLDEIRGYRSPKV